MNDPFNNISNIGKEKIIKNLKAHIINYKKNNIIFKDTDEFAIILKGHVQIIKSNYNGTKNIVQEYFEDDIIETDISFLNSNEYEIISKEETTIILINYNELINSTHIDKFYNQFIKNLFIILNKKSKKNNERINILTKKTIRNKLLEYFNIHSKKNGSKYIYLELNFSALADYLAVDRSALSREIGYLKKEGFIEVKGKRITLLYR